ncbi:MAG: CsbD family protein [Gluconacetobacter diazotrophicus]|nr:CsbD family protein [Gluconacetobacter diazotrophicus]
MVDENKVEGTVTEGIGRVKDAVGGLTGDTSTQAEGKFDQASGRVQAEYGDLLDDARDQLDEAGELIRDNPLVAVGIGLGLGFVLGWLLTPSRG